MFNPYGNAYMPYQYAPQSPQGIAGVRFVNGMDEAKNCLVPIGTRALFMDSKEDVFYIKETDANGISSVTPYSFSKVESSSPQYVTKEQVEEILENWRKRRPQVQQCHEHSFHQREHHRWNPEDSRHPVSEQD